MHLVDEEDDILRCLDLVHRLLNAFLEVAAVFRTRYHRGKVERHNLLAAQHFGNLILDNFQRQSLGDGGLADTGLTDETGIILIAARKNLNNALNFIFSADDGVNLALLRLGSEVVTEFVERGRLALAFLAALRILMRIGFAARDGLGNLLNQRALVHTEFVKKLHGIGIALLNQRDKQMLGTDKGMAHTARNLEGKLDNALRAGCEILGRETGGIARADLGFNQVIDIVEINTLFIEHVSCNTRALTKKSY
jgi:hypothetical protein